MPIIGGVSFIAFRRKWYLAPIAKILTDAHKAFVNSNCKFRTYGLNAQINSTDYVSVTGVTPSDIESGNLKSLLEKAKDNKSGKGISVLIKE